MAADRLRLLFCDHLSLARGKYMPASKIGDGATRFCQGTFAVGYDKEMAPAPGGMMLEGLPDMDAVYRGADIRDCWEPNTKVVIADLQDTKGRPLGLCGRTQLKRTVQEWKAMGLTPKVGLELEAFAFQRDENGKLTPYDTPGAYVYSTGRFADPKRFIDEIWSKATALGFRIDCVTSEYDSPQFEFTLTYDEAVKAVNDIFLFRVLAREVALDHGIVLTFMPKPILTKGGSGLHVNFSFSDKNGKNVFGESKPGEMTDLAKGCIAGLMQHHRGMAGLVAPTVNSYERLKPASLSGYWRNWGVDHRGVTTRLSAEQGVKARIEHRMGDAAANPYTLVTAVLQAAKLGVAGKYNLPPAETADCIMSHDAKDGTPDNLADALKELAADKPLVAGIGELLVANHIGIKEMELERTAKLEGDALRDYYIYYVRRAGGVAMPRVTWVLKDDKKISADVPAGHSLMEAAVKNNVPNVIGECGGCLSCATCHVYVDPEWVEKAGKVSELEDEMLEVTVAERKPNSRLSCQINSAPELDGIVLHVPYI